MGVEKDDEFAHESGQSDFAWFAAAAHDRLNIKVTKVSGTREKLAEGTVTGKKMNDRVNYDTWAGRVVRVELQVAGWRLADLLERIVR